MCMNGCLSLWEKGVCCVFKDEVLRKLLCLRGQKWQEAGEYYVVGSFWSNIICVIRSRGVRCSELGVKRNVYRILDGKPVGSTPLDRPRHRRSDNIKIDLREIGWGALDWILSQDRDQWWAFVDTVWVPWNSCSILTLGGAIGSLFCMTHIVGDILLIFQFAVTECPCISVQCIVVNIRCLLTIFKEGARKL